MLSIDGAFAGSETDRPTLLEEALGAPDQQLERTDVRVSVHQAIRRLSEPLRRIIALRYLRALSQREVAVCLGISQMRVCRMERRALEQLRTHIAIH